MGIHLVFKGDQIAHRVHFSRFDKRERSHEPGALPLRGVGLHPDGKGETLMAVRSGRLEKRIQLSLPVQISNPFDPSSTERTTTVNVCSLGMRVLTQKALELNERIMISSLVGDLRSLARVVYCQRLPDGRFGVGIQFQPQSLHWQPGSVADGKA